MDASQKKNLDKPKIEDVAKIAWVSVATVSRVINKLGSVKDVNRIKVEDAIRQLRYKPDVSAQRLAKGRINSIGLVIPRYEGLFFSFYAIELIRGVGSSCERLGLDLLLIVTDGKKSINLGATGGIIFADILGNRHQLNEVVDTGLPCIVINNIFKDSNVNYVAIDNKKGAMQATEYLLGLGHKDIAIITGDLATQSAALRLEGYKVALKRKKINFREEFILKGDFSRRSSREATSKLLRLKRPPSAIFASCDDMALEAINVILEQGLDVPRDISIIGFDDNPQCLYSHAALTTIRQPLIQMSQMAADMINDLMSGKKVTRQKIVLSPQLIVRDSCRPPKQTR